MQKQQYSSANDHVTARGVTWHQYVSSLVHTSVSAYMFAHALLLFSNGSVDVALAALQSVAGAYSDSHHPCAVHSNAEDLVASI